MHRVHDALQLPDMNQCHQHRGDDDKTEGG
jgi:hypothetical protein